MGRLGLACFLLFASVATAVGGGSSKGGSGPSKGGNGRQREQTFRSAGYYGQPDGNRTLKPEQSNGPEPAVRRKSSGLSAWGIVTLVVSIIMLSILAYYCTIFYPMLCKKERKYDIIELEKV